MKDAPEVLNAIVDKVLVHRPNGPCRASWTREEGSMDKLPNAVCE
ncbi:hypothetical protein HDF15_002290 [Granulicella mallensis]|uniref:Uncharacterized protein n=1 Tax=Granulicella mallensis TaxID=940614 RepID=A0A7W7ZQK7_9BACT|nr:hypothetical protein [Granulicella mallensis]